MLNYQGIAQDGAERILKDMKEKMIDDNYCINKAVITVDIDNMMVSVDTLRKNSIGIEFEGKAQLDLKKFINEKKELEKQTDGCKCQNCGVKYKTDILVSDDIWEKIKPDGKAEGAGLLCGNCIFTKIENLDTNTTYTLKDIERSKSNNTDNNSFS